MTRTRVTDDQIRLLEPEKQDLSARERWLVERLQGYLDLDFEIDNQRKIISGELTNCLPSMSPAAPRDDDPYVLAALNEPVSERLQIIVEATKKAVRVSPETKYVHSEMVARQLRYARSDNAAEDRALQDAYVMVTERHREEPIKLTEPEQYADCRFREVAKAREQLAILEARKRAIDNALYKMQYRYPEWHEFLWSRYVQGEKYSVWVTRLRSEQTYRTVRKNALHQFEKWAVGLY